MRKKLNSISIFGAVFSLVIVGSTSAVVALATSGNAVAKTATSNTPVSASSNVSRKQQVKTQEQQQAKMRICQQRQANVTKIMSNITTRVNNQLTLFNKIATNVENFYNSSNSKHTVTNYAALVQNINQAKLQALNDQSNLDVNASFSCSSNNPKGMVTTFQGYMKTEISDLGNYRTSIKNLIVAVAKANGLTIRNTNSSGN